MGDAPTGLVTFLFTDIEGSTRRWEEDADAMRRALSLHDDALRLDIERESGVPFAPTGDGVGAHGACPVSRRSAEGMLERLVDQPSGDR